MSTSSDLEDRERIPRIQHHSPGVLAATLPYPDQQQDDRAVEGREDRLHHEDRRGNGAGQSKQNLTHGRIDRRDLFVVDMLPRLVSQEEQLFALRRMEIWIDAG